MYKGSVHCVHGLCSVCARLCSVCARLCSVCRDCGPCVHGCVVCVHGLCARLCSVCAWAVCTDVLCVHGLCARLCSVCMGCVHGGVLCAGTVAPVCTGYVLCAGTVCTGCVLCAGTVCTGYVLCAGTVAPVCTAVTALINGCPSDEVQLSSGADQLTGAPLKSWSSSPHEPRPMSKAVNAIVCLKRLLFQPQPQLLGGKGVGGAAGKGSSASGSHSLTIDHWPG